jgi:hypothetical protein
MAAREPGIDHEPPADAVGGRDWGTAPVRPSTSPRVNGSTSAR